MPRYVIEEDRAIWVREVFEVEADTEDEALEAEDERNFLGFTPGEHVAYLDPEVYSIEQTDATPFMTHPNQEDDK